MLDWNFIKGLTSPVPLRQLMLEPVQIQDHLYQLGQHEFLSLSPRQMHLDGPSELFANIFYWAPTVAAARRVVQRDIAGDDGSLLCPPREILVDGWRWSYADIIEGCQHNDIGPMMTSQILKGGANIGRHLAVGNLSFYFRSGDDQTEKAFAVAVDIRGIRWRPCG